MMVMVFAVFGCGAPKGSNPFEELLLNSVPYGGKKVTVGTDKSGISWLKYEISDKYPALKLQEHYKLYFFSNGFQSYEPKNLYDKHHLPWRWESVLMSGVSNSSSEKVHVESVRHLLSACWRKDPQDKCVVRLILKYESPINTQDESKWPLLKEQPNNMKMHVLVNIGSGLFN
jgi:hypothetical protein